MLDSDVDDPVVEDNMVDDGLFVGLFVLDVDDSSCKLTVVYVYCHAQVLRPCLHCVCVLSVSTFSLLADCLL